MKQPMMLLTLLILATACDSPQRNRLPSTLNQSDGFRSSTGNLNSTSWTTGTGSMTNPLDDSASGSTTGNPARPAGFENCDITPKYHAMTINHIGICQSTLDETSLAVSSTVTDTTRTCLIPTYKDQMGNSTYLGQPQCFIPEQGKVSQGSVYKTRQGFTQNPINGVMVMKESSLGAYFTCMNAVALFPKSICPQGPTSSKYCEDIYNQCPNGSRSNDLCAKTANADMVAKCDNFKSTNAYLDITLKKTN